jgi:transposase
VDNGNRYVGLDVHRDTISVAVLDSRGKVILEKVIATAAGAVWELVALLRGKLHVAFEEGTSADWLAGLLQPRVAQVVVCDPRKNDRRGTKSDRIDARELADLLRCGRLSPVFHQDCGLSSLEELARTYLVLTKDQTRVMNRIKALYRSWAIACTGQSCYTPRRRQEWLAQLPHRPVRGRAEIYYQQMDSLQQLRQHVRAQLLQQGRKHPAFGRLRQIPYIGPMRAILLIVFIQTPHRFRSKRQLWAYCGLALETHDSGEYRFRQGQLQRKRQPTVVGLNRNHHHLLKYVLKSVAARGCSGSGPVHDFAQNLLDQGMRPEMVRLTVARKIAAIVLALWKKGVAFDARYLKPQAAGA